MPFHSSPRRSPGSRTWAGITAVSLILASISASPGRGARADAPTDESTNLVAARTAFEAGAAQVEASKWGEALSSFEKSAALRPHALTTYNIGVC